MAKEIKLKYRDGTEIIKEVSDEFKLRVILRNDSNNSVYDIIRIDRRFGTDDTPSLELSNMYKQITVNNLESISAIVNGVELAKFESEIFAKEYMISTVTSNVDSNRMLETLDFRVDVLGTDKQGV